MLPQRQRGRSGAAYRSGIVAIAVTLAIGLPSSAVAVEYPVNPAAATAEFCRAISAAECEIGKIAPEDPTGFPDAQCPLAPAGRCKGMSRFTQIAAHPGWIAAKTLFIVSQLELKVALGKDTLSYVDPRNGIIHVEVQIRPAPGGATGTEQKVFSTEVKCAVQSDPTCDVTTPFAGRPTPLYAVTRPFDDIWVVLPGNGPRTRVTLEGVWIRLP